MNADGRMCDDFPSAVVNLPPGYSWVGETSDGRPIIASSSGGVDAGSAMVRGPEVVTIHNFGADLPPLPDPNPPPRNRAERRAAARKARRRR